jgi:hypothetical protein
MKEAKAASVNGRKRLNELTRAFRGRAKEEQLNIDVVMELLKAYQEEIDQLAKRAKYRYKVELYKM